MVAWKADTRLAILLETDARLFTQLILSTFLQSNYLVNDQLSLLRIQTVNVDGTPQDFDEIMNHSRSDVKSRESEALSAGDWQKHVEAIQSLGLLANKASEYEIKKHLTEGKSGIVQPDLISSKNIEESLLNTIKSPDTPKKKLLTLEKTDEKIKGLKVEYQRQELLKSPMAPTASFPDGKDIEPQVATLESPKFPTASPAKSPNPSIVSKISSEPQSPKFPSGSPAKKSSFEPKDKPSVVKLEPKITKKEPPMEQEIKKSIPSVKKTTQDFLASEKEQPAPNEAKPKQAPVEVKKKEPEPTKPKPLDLSPLKPKEPQQLPQETAKLSSSHSIRRKKQKLTGSKPPNILVYSDSVTTRDNVIKTLGCILQKSTYTIYPLTKQQVCSRIWMDNASLLVVCGSVNGSDAGTIFLDFFFKGGKVLCLCSDLLRHVLPTYHTAEVRHLLIIPGVVVSLPSTHEF